MVKRQEEIYKANFDWIRKSNYITDSKHYKRSAFLLSTDGRIAINKRNALCDVIYAVFVSLSKAEPGALIDLQKKYLEQYPNISDFDDFEREFGNIQTEKIPYIMGALLVPTELTRREVRKKALQNS